MRQAVESDARAPLRIRLIDKLLVHHTDNWFTRTVLPLIAIVGATTLSVVLADASPLPRVGAALIAIFVGGIYGQYFFQRLRPPRT